MCSPPDNVVQSRDKGVGVRLGSSESVLEIRWVGGSALDMSSESHKAGEDDENEDDDLEESEQVLKSKSPSRQGAVEEEGKSDDSDTDSSLIPSSEFGSGGIQQHFTRVHTVSGRPSEESLVRKRRRTNKEETARHVESQPESPYIDLLKLLHTHLAHDSQSQTVTYSIGSVHARN